MCVSITISLAASDLNYRYEFVAVKILNDIGWVKQFSLSGMEEGLVLRVQSIMPRELISLTLIIVIPKHSLHT